MKYFFPFGEEVKRVVQQDQTPKKVFVLGVYASAVHAKWVKDKKEICRALAVASEPYIFWDGNPDEAQAVIDNIKIPPDAGKLMLPNQKYNGPSSKVLSENILKPLGITRNEAWLCDLLPESRLNANQQRVIREKYNPLVENHELNRVTVPNNDLKFCDDIRRSEITKEIIDSKAEYLVLLGDDPIKQYLKHIDSKIPFNDLKQYAQQFGYGSPSEVNIGEYKIKVLPLAHPRQIGGLGNSSKFWFDEHKMWELKNHDEFNDKDRE